MKSGILRKGAVQQLINFHRGMYSFAIYFNSHQTEFFYFTSCCTIRGTRPCSLTTTVDVHTLTSLQGQRRMVQQMISTYFSVKQLHWNNFFPPSAYLTYSATRKLCTQLSRAPKCTRVYTCENLVIATNTLERQNVLNMRSSVSE